MVRKILAVVASRIETGALQINDDWPGLFIRGDNCELMKGILERVCEGKTLTTPERWFLVEIIDKAGETNATKT